MPLEVVPRAVERDERARTGELNHMLLLEAVSVPAGVHGGLADPALDFEPLAKESAIMA